MFHARTQIRDAVVAKLMGLTTTGNRVYPSRVHPLEEEALPGLLVFSKSEPVETSTINPPRTQTRSLAIQVEAYVKATGNFDDVVDTACAEVEQAIGSDPTLSGQVKDIRLTDTEIALAGSGEKPVAVATLTFQATYCTKENNPTLAL